MRSAAALTTLILSACMSASNTADTTSAATPPAATPPAAPAANSDPDNLVNNGGVTVSGWTGRLDPRAVTQGRSLADVKFVTMGGGVHVTAGPAAIYWNPANATEGGNFTVAATFTQTKASAHPEGYGLFFGGQNLTASNQSYMYYLVRQDGKFLVNHRASDNEVHRIVDWKAHPAIRAIDAAGKSTNALSIAIGPEKVSFIANGAEVHSIPRSTVDAGGNHAGTRGIVGLRVNHNLDLHVDGFALTRQ